MCRDKENQHRNSKTCSIPFDVISFLQVEDKSAKQTYFFLCQRWLATDEDDGQIMRTLVPVDPSLKAKMGSGSKSIRDEVALEQKGRKHEIVGSTAYSPNIYACACISKFGTPEVLIRQGYVVPQLVVRMACICV